MREILFKGKSTKTGEWVYGDLDARLEGCIVILSKTTCPTLNVTSFKNHIIDPSTICEFTGVLDSKRARIFEGDSDSLGNFIQYMNGAWFITRQKTDWYLHQHNHTITVTGNIHDKDSK